MSGVCLPYFSTACKLEASTCASSLTRCGRLPVFSICCIVPTTMSSLIPSTSTLLLPSAAGDGGGDSSTACFGFSSLNLMVVVRGGLIKPGGGGDDELCNRFDFLTGGSSPSKIVFGGEGWEAVRERLGTMIPSSDRESDFRLVLYGMVVVGGFGGVVTVSQSYQ